MLFFFMRDQVHETLEIEPEMRCFSIVTDKTLGTTINPYPINEEDLLDCDGEVPEQFEESLDDHEKLLNLLEDSYSLCNVHTAQINVQRFRDVGGDHEKLLNLLEDSDSLCNVHTAQINAQRSGDVGSDGSDEVSVLAAEAGKGVAELLLHGVHKAHASIAKFRNALNDEELEDKLGFRCAECAKCLTCKTSSRRTAISLREAREQQFIEESVRVDTKLRRVLVNYPFLKDPVEYLSGVHRNPNNYGQAVKVYKTQCRKSDTVKEGMRKVHADLVEKGFMVKLEDMDKKKKELIKNASFQHYNPWRLVMKMDSMTTPVRMVVDPTMTSFNEILAKGENRIGLIFTIMIRRRCMQYIWSSDISKLYNQLILDDPSLPYSLFLYSAALNPEKEPDVWVMVRAWYGIVSTGGQAGYALDKLTEMMADEFPEAYRTLRENRYVDDLLSGAQDKESREKQITAVQEVLKRGGFNLKFVVRSGDKPSDKASSDGETMKLLGYKWDPEKDELSPGLGELNLNKKRRGEKKPNLEPVRTIKDAENLLSGILLTRSLIVGKISEFFYP